MLGICIGIFFKNPAHQRNLLSNPEKLLHSAMIKLGSEVLSLRVSAVINNEGTFIGAMTSWDVITELVTIADDFKETVLGISKLVSSSGTELQASSQSLATLFEQTNHQSATEELSASISEISNQLSQDASSLSQAYTTISDAGKSVRKLESMASKIGEIVRLISDIAKQTNLLALNAMIVAACAGEAGTGFAVVASEAKNSANQTARATQDITDHVSGFQDAATGAVQNIEKVAAQVLETSKVTTFISRATEEQSAAAQKVSRNVEMASKAATEPGEVASEVKNSSDQLAENAVAMKKQLGEFLNKIRNTF